MLTLYFSGTGNSKYIAEGFSKRLDAKCYSIEEKVDFENLIKEEKEICFCYPIYASSVPRIMREFVARYKQLFDKKKVVILCTQLMFSGDGARVFTNLLKGIKTKVIYAEHFNMPNNICNTNFFKVTNGNENKKYIKNANKKLDKVCKDIKDGKIFKRGFNNFSKFLGSLQGSSFPTIEKHAQDSVNVNENCIKCNACIKCCPMQNLELVNNKVTQKNNCTLCYRCANLCPEKAINLIFKTPIKVQYKGIKNI